MSVAKQFATLPLPCINKKQVLSFLCDPRESKSFLGYIWALWSNKWNRDGNHSLCYTADLRRLRRYRWSTGVLTSLSTMPNPKVIKRPDLSVLTSVGSAAAKIKEEKRQAKGKN